MQVSQLKYWAVVWALFAGQCYTAHGQLVTQPPGCANNPLNGQGEPPDGLHATALPVQIGVLNAAILEVDENMLIWRLLWEDSRAAPLMMREYSVCQFWCASRPSLTLNKFGQPACCDGVYIPQAEALNTRGYNVQDMPDYHEINLLSNDTVIYSKEFVGTFASSWAYSAFPWDDHYVTLDLQTSFLPILGPPINGQRRGAAFVATDGYTSGGMYRPSVISQSVPEWDIKRIGMETLNISYIASQNPDDFRAEHDTPDFYDVVKHTDNQGIRVYIQIQRRTTWFWLFVLVVPVGLVTIFSFAAQSFGRHEVKNRIELLTTLFLTLVLLQFTMQAILPGAFILTLPLLLVLVSYLYFIALFSVFLLSNALGSQHLRRQRKAERRHAANLFSEWEAQLYMSLGSCTLGCKPDNAGYKQELEQPTQARQNAASTGPHLEVDVEGRGAGGGYIPTNQYVPDKAARSSFRMEPDDIWVARQRRAWFYACQPIRVGVFLWRFMGKFESREYCDMVAHQFDMYARAALLLTYLVIVTVMCCTTANKADEGAEWHVISQD